MNILLVEDDLETAQAVSRGLTRQGHDMRVATTATEAIDLVEKHTFDVAILDVKLPEGSGYDVLEHLRAKRSPTQVLMLTALGAISDRVEGLDRGADDYLVKPFSFAELVARLRALERRPKGGHSKLSLGPLRLDLMNRKAYTDGEKLELTQTEFSLLATLIRGRGAAVSRRALLQDVWGYDFDPGTNVVDVHVNRLRRKLEERGMSDVIQTVRGSGYVVE